MAQQPNIEITDGEKPRQVPAPGPAVKWRFDKPGIPAGPDDVPRGGSFGQTGPDPGWAYKVVAKAKLPDPDPRLREIVTGLVLARAAALGRAPVPEDVDAALVVCGYADDAPREAKERRKRWLLATAHDLRPGQTAIAEVDIDLLVNKPDQIRYAMRRAEKGDTRRLG